MNKYQQALDRMEENYYNNDTSFGAMKNFKKDVETLQELVDKTTPKNPVLSEDLRDEDQTDIYDENGHIYPYMCVCPNCKKPTIYDFEYNVKFDYCRDCGQRILWEE